MTGRLAVLVVSLSLAVALPVAAEGPAEGRIEGEGVHVEVLGQAVAVGERVDLPEGWFRLEEEGVEDREVGSFSIVAPSDAGDGTAVALASAAPAPAVPPATAKSGPPCRAERSAYLRELLRISGVEVEDPEALLEGLDAGQGGATGYGWFALQTDPLRPMAWSSDLRDRARALAACVREHRGDR